MCSKETSIAKRSFKQEANWKLPKKVRKPVKIFTSYIIRVVSGTWEYILQNSGKSVFNPQVLPQRALVVEIQPQPLKSCFIDNTPAI